ncbi:MAG: hypothetical protein HKP21_14030 [Xanthomonadales bacterium]|nr:hypothetical protein [Gammaproteobacteria bacterium]NNK05666.1 hypothetical protein [Xanthomonadales bacterium]
MSFSAHADVVRESGDLESYLNSISFGVEDDGRFKIPTAGQLADFETVVNLVLQADYDNAHTAAEALGYELVAYTDSVTAKLFYVLREINPIPSPLANGNGIYIFRPAAAYNVAIHAPHPAADRNTNKGAITTFMASDVRYFMMAGAHRRSHPDPSSCQGFSDYRPSDAVHNTAHYFFVAHKALENFDDSIHYVELHGYGSSSFDTIASQCDTGGNPAVANLSETISDADPAELTLMHSLESALNAGGEIETCIYSTTLDSGPADKYTQYLGRSTNTLARYTNGSVSVCDQAALAENNSHRYLHIEQSWGIRETADTRELMATAINQAIQDYFAATFKINPGLSDAWYNPATSGQGFFITVFPDLNSVSLAWFTYDTEYPPEGASSNLGDPGHRWLVAVGAFSGNTAVLDISVVSGGLFDTRTIIDEQPGGSITLTFNHCNSATVDYDITAINRQGRIPIQRVATDNVPLCEALGQ